MMIFAPYTMSAVMGIDRVDCIDYVDREVRSSKI